MFIFFVVSGSFKGKHRVFGDELFSPRMREIYFFLKGQLGFPVF